ncbi:MAG: hypothetical protein RIQ79_961 [Verrucomicrobiota bacterium]|jgi:hypothetical protein
MGMKSSPVPYCYPVQPHVRKHGPFGYKHWDDYREWLRDDFEFRCVYCLRREVWDRKRALWAVEHLIPRATAPHRALDYTNLVYACVLCNSAKSAQLVPDPCQYAYGKLVSVTEDGRIHALNAEGQRLIRSAALDEEDLVRFREERIALLRNYKKHEPERYRAAMGFPEDLPDLEGKKPPGGNTKSDGAKNCRHRQRLNGTLPLILELA